ncbi:asparagine synthase-related protein [Halobacteria archaeon AArc-curdl1]|uniref:Asparagine synthase-related protein n=1 Tax=Natronosalvus hydrolyticus TaxID=2979988 RepID=A0AAP2Z8B5_9EURY|nr:asparagine synthase-related protein [Halobacteria archaeon AArc-curdl1]
MYLTLHADGWVRARGVAVRGRAFDGNRLLEEAALAERFGRVLADAASAGDDGEEPNGTAEADAAFEAIADCAGSLEGFFAAVVGLESEGRTYLVADGARSIPLYYAETTQFVSDRGNAVRDAIDAPRDPLTEREFLLTRYVTGPETIWDGVYAVQPGEVVALGADGIRRDTYREYWPAGPGRETTPRCDSNLESRDAEPAADVDLLEAAFDIALDRLEAVAGDRPIVLPLSGGFDSRLLASALVERGREVIGFTFGRSGHPDVEMSREVAARLGIRWEFYPYSQADWHEWYHGTAGRRYREWAFGGDALPFLAEWPALHGLLEAGRLPEDGLYCPGHTVATPSERLPRFVGERRPVGETNVGCAPAVDADEETDEEPRIEPTLEALVEHVLETHYTLWEWDDDSFETAARARIRDGLLGERPSEAIDSPETAGAAYERWEWRGRMSTFTNGDCRAYEDAGLEWWLPLWDPAYVRAWTQVPLARRRGKRLHAELAAKIYRRATGVSTARSRLTDRTLEPADRVLSLVRHTPERQWTERDGDWLPPFLAPRSAWREPGTHPLAWDGAVETRLLEALPEQARNFYALRTLAETGRLDLDDPDPTVCSSGLSLPTLEAGRR